MIEPGESLTISAEVFRNQVSTVCLSGIASEIELEEVTARKARLEVLLIQELRKLGLYVVESERVANIWDEVNEDRGGFYDIHWGTVIAHRRDAIREAFYAESFERLDCDAIVDASIVQVESPIWNGSASWDHATLPVWHRTSSSTYWFTGHVPAVSLRISIRDAPDHEIYYGAGGVHLGVSTAHDEYTAPHLEAIESDRYLAYEFENLRALRYALRELSDKLWDVDHASPSR